MNPPAGVPLVALALPLLITAGAVHGTALAITRSGDELFALAPLLTHAG